MSSTPSGCAVSSESSTPISQPVTGVKAPQSAKDTAHVSTDDYYTRFPDDGHCEETDANARVWRAYKEEAAAFDANMVRQSRDGLDVMLVFAGLFSAVVTSFLVQASQNLQADYAQITAILVHDLVFIQLAMADGSSVLNITLPSVDPTAPFVASEMDVWVNGFWVVSLAASLVVALAAVLIRQWLNSYVSLPSGTPRHCSSVRQFRFTGLELWRVRIIIGMLPIIMHLSLALFLSGLILFLIPLRTSLAWAIGVITVLLCILYLVSNALPILFPQCPYRTPLSDFFNYANQAVTVLWHSLWKAVATPVPVEHGLDKGEANATEHCFQSLMILKDASVFDSIDKVTVDALDWFYTVSSNPALQEIVLLAIGGLPVEAQKYAIWHDSIGMQHTRARMVVSLTKPGSAVPRTCLPGSEPTFERISRSFLFLPNTGVFDWQNAYRGIGDARFDLALAITPMIQKPPDAFEIRKLFISYHRTVTHELVWKELIAMAASNGAFRLRDPKVTPSDHARFISVILPAKYGLHTALQDALALSEPVIWDHLLEMPSVSTFDIGPSRSASPPYRVLLAAAEFALHHIDAHEQSPALSEPTVDTRSSSDVQCHWTLLETVLDRFASGYFYPSSEPLEGLVQVIARAVALGDFIDLESAPSPPRQDKCMSAILEIYSSIALEEPSPLIPRLLHASLSRLQYNLDSQHNQHHLDERLFFSILRSTSVLMVRLLSFDEGQQLEAFNTFIDDKWMHHFGPLWVVGWTRRQWLGHDMITTYIYGLASPLIALSRQEFIDHLYEPENLVIAMCALIGDAEWMRRLVELNPTHASWERCRAILKTIVDWNASPTTEFPVDLVRGVIVRCSNRSIPLDKQLRTWLTGDEARENLDGAMQVISQLVSIPKGLLGNFTIADIRLTQAV